MRIVKRNKKINAGALDELNQRITRIEQNFENVREYVSQIEAINGSGSVAYPKYYELVNDASEYEANSRLIEEIGSGTLFGNAIINLDYGINYAHQTLLMIKDRLSKYEEGINTIENDASKRIEDIDVKSIFDDNNTSRLTFIEPVHHTRTPLHYAEIAPIETPTGEIYYANNKIEDFVKIDREQYLKKLNDTPTEKVAYVEDVSPEVSKRKLYNLNKEYKDEKELTAVKNSSEAKNINDEFDLIEDENILMEIDDELAKEFKELAKLSLEEANSSLNDL